MELVVITHNGEMPADGGLRMGYRCGDRYLDIASGRSCSISAFLTAQAKAEVPAKTLLIHSQLPTCNIHGDCVNCGKRDNRRCGEQIATCSSCGTKMRFLY